MRFLLATAVLLVLLALIVWQVCRPANRERYEKAGRRMLEPDGDTQDRNRPEAPR